MTKGIDKREMKNSEGSHVGVILLSTNLKEKVKCLSSVVLSASTKLRETYLSIGLISVKQLPTTRFYYFFIYLEGLITSLFQSTNLIYVGGKSPKNVKNSRLILINFVLLGFYLLRGLWM